MEESAYVPYDSHLPSGDTFLVLAPHPDDEIYGAGGTLALLAAEGREIHIHILSGGEEQGDAERRHEESREACRILGLPEPRFADFPDRRFSDLEEEIGDLAGSLTEEISPDCIILPGPEEAHPDHRALCRAVLSHLHGIRGDSGRFRGLSIAFMEISLPQRIDLLVDITSVMDAKMEAMKQFASQQDLTDYATRIEGLNRYRSSTLPAPAEYAEGFRIVEAKDIPLCPLSRWVEEEGEVVVEASGEDLTLIIRTRNRLPLLKEALASVSALREGPSQVLVVNDGGEPVEKITEGFPNLPLKVIYLPENRGRAAAANEGLRAAGGDLIAFLDDDDLLYPEHFSLLRRIMGAEGAGVVYSDAVSMIMGRDENGNRVITDRILAYSRDFDAEWLLFDNYIPFHTLMIRRSVAEEAGRLDEQLDLFEDWEWLIRLSRVSPFVHIPRVTCAYRHFGQGATLGIDPRNNPRFLEGRRRVMEMTSAYRDAAVVERVARRMGDLLAEAKAEAARLAGEIHSHRRTSKRLSREVHSLGTELGGVTDALARERRERAEESNRLRKTEESCRREVETLRVALEEEQTARSGLEEHLAATYAEIERLNAILTRVYASKTFRLHSLLQKILRRT